MANHISYQRDRFNETISRVPKRYRATARFFLYEILFRANWKDSEIATEYETLSLKRGQLPIGLHALAEDLGCSVQNLRTVLKWFETNKQITSETTNRGTVLTIVNYDSYVYAESETNKQKNENLTRNQQATNNSEEVKEVQEEKNKEKNNMSANADVQAVIDRYKQKILPKARTTDAAVKKIATRLKAFTVEELTTAIDNFAQDNWWMQHNAHRGIKWFFHTDDRIDQFINLSEKKAADSTVQDNANKQSQPEWNGQRKFKTEEEKAEYYRQADERVAKLKAQRAWAAEQVRLERERERMKK